MVRLSARIRPTAVTLEHVPKSLSPNSTISSAPKDFAILVSIRPTRAAAPGAPTEGDVGVTLRLGREADLEKTAPGWEMALQLQLSQATEEETEAPGAK